MPATPKSKLPEAPFFPPSFAYWALLSYYFVVTVLVIAGGFWIKVRDGSLVSESSVVS